jgi:hypothetical protein
MKTTSERLTQRLLVYLQSKPKGHYAPYDIRMDLGISSTSWKWFTTRFVYPEGSEVRAKLAEIGVSIETVLKSASPGSGHRSVLTSRFVVSG